MERDYIGNLKVLAAINRNTVSEQNLKLLEIKYNLSDSEMHTLVQYCKDQGIEIYDEEKKAYISNKGNKENSADCHIIKNDSITEEEKDNQKLASIIAKRIMHMAAIKARKRVNGRGWLCGTYARSKRRLVEFKIRSLFSEEELKYIVDHLKDSEEELFAMEDQQDPGMCKMLNDKLNELIPRLHINHYYSDLFDD